MSGRPDLEDIFRAFQAPGTEPSREGAPPGLSAVLLPLYDGDEGPSLLYTRRAAGLRNHAGEMSFPGGRVDPVDLHPLAAALRETHEEVGVPPEDVQVLGHLTDYLTYRDVLVCAYVGAVVGPAEPHAPEAAPRRGRREPPREPRSRDEVEEVVVVPVRDLLDPARYEARRIAGMPERSVVHYWHLPACTVWGITGELTARFLQRVWGWKPPSAAREIDSIEEFRPRRVAP